MQYKRFFIALGCEHGGYEFKGRRPVGRCILEANGSIGKLSVWVQDVKPEIIYKVYILFCENGETAGVPAGTLRVDYRGKGEMRWEFNTENVGGSFRQLQKISAVAIIVPKKDELIAPLVGYKDGAVPWKNNFSEVTFKRDRQKPPQPAMSTPIRVSETPDDQPMHNNINEPTPEAVPEPMMRESMSPVVPETLAIERGDLYDAVPEAIRETAKQEYVSEALPETPAEPGQKDSFSAALPARQLEENMESADLPVSPHIELVNTEPADTDHLNMIRMLNFDEAPKAEAPKAVEPEEPPVEMTAAETRTEGIKETAERMYEAPIPSIGADGKGINEFLQAFKLMQQKFNIDFEGLKDLDISEMKSDAMRHERERYPEEHHEYERHHSPADPPLSPMHHELEYIFNNNISMKPFVRQSRDVKWVRVSMREPVYMSLNYHYLFNTPFIVSAYKKYNHLIMGVSEDLSGRLFLLGVPGIYEQEYKPIALKLGFTQFKCCDDIVVKEGAYGYWLMPVV